MAIDMYGDNRVTEHLDQAKGWMQAITANQEAWQRRAAACLAQLKAVQGVGVQRLAAIGYCFGSATVLEMADAG